MILSASRRTDIPCYYGEWFMNRIREGYVCVRNPMNHRQISRIDIRPSVVDCIVFWTKNPVSLLPFLEELNGRGYRYYFQFTLTPYGRDLEKGLPDKESLTAIFAELGRRLGRERMVWRYDPIILNDFLSVSWHKKQFSYLCGLLADSTESVTISFVDLYAKLVRGGTDRLRIPDTAEEEELAAYFCREAANYGLAVKTCCERDDLAQFGVQKAACIDKVLIERITQGILKLSHDKGQRDGCGCYESIDIGAYDTCRNGCVYCYAIHGSAYVEETVRKHDPSGELLTGFVAEGEKVSLRRVNSCLDRQQRLEDLL